MKITRTKGGFLVPRYHALGIVIAFIASLLFVGLLAHFLTGRPEATGTMSAAISTGLTTTVDRSKTTAIEPDTTHSGRGDVDVRLPRHVLPRHYDIRLLPVIEKGNFTIIGRVSIDVECMEEATKIVLHSADINVDARSVQLTEKKGNSSTIMAVEGIEYEAEMEFLVVRLRKGNLVKGRTYTLSMDFEGKLTDQLRGFYRSSYQENGVERFLAVSQMEPTDARRAFPCFDEPNMKATFSVTLGRHRNMTALSNMPLINSAAIEGMQNFYWDEFEKSVPMSTYLVAFIVGDFAQVPANVDNSKWKFNIYARPFAKNQTGYATTIGPKILAFFEDFFQIPFPLPKQDMIAIPDFASGAMENWGAVTYRESALLYDPTVSSITSKEWVLQVISHELAHQWFGNLVTMDWWTDLWLNEGFASYVEYLGSQQVEPTFNTMQQLVTSKLQSVMRLDALESSHPISVEVRHPDEVNEIFDGISYDKGASIIRMLAHFIGENTFRQGLTNYLKSRKYGNAVQDDLWEAFSQQAKTDGVPLPVSVKQIMDTWTLKMGFPLVSVTRHYPSRQVAISQERFLVQRSNKSSRDPSVYLWWVPVTYTTDSQTVRSVWLADDEPSKSLELDSDVTDDQWLLVNVNQTGYYRVNYDERNWRLLAQQLLENHTVIPVINRAQIMDDALNLAEAGRLGYDTALELTRYMEHETEYLPWGSALGSLSYVRSMLLRSSGYKFFKRHVSKLIAPLYESVGFNHKEDDSFSTVKLRVDIISWACAVGNKDCISNAIRTYNLWMTYPENDRIVSADLKSTVSCTAIREGGEEEWDFALHRYGESNVASEQEVLLSALSCSREPWILSRMLEMSLNSTSGIRKQDAATVIRQVAENPLGRYLAFAFIRDRWSELSQHFSASVIELTVLVDSVAKLFNTQNELEELLEFIQENPELEVRAARSIQQSIDRAKNNLSWMEKNYDPLVKWLQRTYQ